MELSIKRIYDSPSKEDGLRIFVDRLWARGLSKEKAVIDLWEKDIAPSTGLRKWYAHDSAKFDEFKSRYIEELNANTKATELKQELLRQEGKATLLFSAKDAEHSNAAVLKSWLEE